MWTITTQGAYSTVAHRSKPGTLLVRCRVQEDLRNLEAQVPGVKDRMYEDRSADYPWRAEVSIEEWAMALARLACAIDYDNFKNAVSKRQGAARSSIYHGVWNVLTKLEPGFWPRYSSYGSTLPYSTGSQQVLLPDHDHDDDSDWICLECGQANWPEDEGCCVCHTPKPEPITPIVVATSRSLRRSRGKGKSKKGAKR